MSSQMVVENALVTVAVKMYDLQGHLLEETEPEGVQYWHGHGDIFQKIEKSLENRFAGEGVDLTLEPEEAFGEYDPDALMMVEVATLGDPETIVPGLQFEVVPGHPQDGRIWRVTDVAEGMAVLETNHPLAGWTLRFEVKILNVSMPGDEGVTTDEVTLPSFLQFADKICPEEDDETEAPMPRA